MVDLVMENLISWTQYQMLYVSLVVRGYTPCVALSHHLQYEISLAHWESLGTRLHGYCQCINDVLTSTLCLLFGVGMVC